MSSKRLTIKNLGQWIWVVLFTGITPFLFEPVKNYLSNVNEYWFTLDMLFSLLLMTSLVVIVVLSLLLLGVSFLPSKVSSKVCFLVTSFLFLITVGIYIQGNLIPSTTGSLDGTSIDWGIVNLDMILSDVLWGLLLIVFIVVVVLGCKESKNVNCSEDCKDSEDCKGSEDWKDSEDCKGNELRTRVYRGMKITSICLVLLEVSTVISLMLMNPGFNDTPYFNATDKNEFEFSSKQNMILLVLDNYDSMYFYESLYGGNANGSMGESASGNADENLNVSALGNVNGGVSEIFEDFTYYPDTVSKYGHTDLSLPQMLTGKCYLNETPFIDYLKGSYENSDLLNYFNENGWRTGLYTETPLPKTEILAKCDNLVDYNCKISSKRRFLEYIYRIVAYNVTPYHMKKVFWFYPEFTDFKLSPSEEYDLYTWGNQRFYDALDTAGNTVEEPAFKLFHLKGMHVVFETDENVRDVGYEVGMEATREANFKIIEKLISKLKDLGVYDDSIIMIMADHGDSYMLSSGETGLGSLMEVGCEYKQNPLLLIKGVREHHEFKVSDKKISYDDLMDAYKKLLGCEDGDDNSSYVTDERLNSDLTGGENIFSDISDDRVRIFYKHDDTNGENSSAYLSEIKEYSIEDNAWKTNELKETGKVYAEK